MPVVERRRSPRLSEDVDGKRREPRARSRAVCDRAAHPREYQRAVRGLYFDVRALRRLEAFRPRASWDEHASAVEERGVCGHELRGRDAKLFAVAEHLRDARALARELSR